MEPAYNLCTREDMQRDIQKHGANLKCTESLRTMCATSRNLCLKKPKMKVLERRKVQDFTIVI